jgi:general nucleoside transport system permease protein
VIRRLALGAAAPVLAALIALAVTTAILVATGSSVSGFFSTIFSVPAPRNLINIANNSAILFLSGLAAAIGFRMNLFNIGVEGQYRVGAFAAAVFAAQGWLPGPFNIVVSILLAMAVGALWAAIAGVLKVTRGVSEVISTIMLNAIAGSLTAYGLRYLGITNGSNIQTKTIPTDSWVPGIPLVSSAPNTLFGLALLAVVAGVAIGLLLNRSRFGFDLRTTGASPTAAVASGIAVRRMVVTTMIISGAIAGLIGLPELFGSSHTYGATFQAGIGFAGIAVALLGSNRPVGIALSAVLFAYLSEQSAQLEINVGVSTNIIAVTQGVLVLAVVIAYELVRRYRMTEEQQRVGRALAAQGPRLETARVEK